MRHRIMILICVWVCVGLSASGCSRSERTGRPSQDPQPPIKKLIAAADAVAQALAADLNRLADEDFGGYRVTLKLGGILNKTEIVPTADFELIQNRIKNRLLQSGMFRDNVKVVESPDRIRRPKEPEDPFELLPPVARVPGENPEYVYHLLGDAYAVHRPPAHLYYISFQLVRESNLEVVFVKDYEVNIDVSELSSVMVRPRSGG